MLSVEESITIDRPIDEVWEFFSDPANVPLYSSNIEEYTVIAGEPDAVGRRCHGTARVAGRTLEFTDELVEREEADHAKLVSQDATIPYSLEMSVAEEGSGTRFTWHQEMESLKGFFKFADPIVLKLYARDVRANLEKAKTILES